RLERPVGGHQPAARGASVAEPLAGGTRLPAGEGGVGAGPPRGPVVARVPSPRVPGDAGVRVSHAGAAPSPSGAIPAGQKGGYRAPVMTLPAIRRALQRLLGPISRPDCGYCRPWIAQLQHKLTE